MHHLTRQRVNVRRISEGESNMEFIIGLCIGIIVSPILTTLLNKVVKITWGKEKIAIL